MANIVTVARVDELPAGSRKVVQVGETYVLVVNIAGEYYAIEDVCTHDGNELADGIIEDCTIECSRHGARFDFRTGKGTFPAVTPVQTFPIHVVGDDVQIEVPEE